MTATSTPPSCHACHRACDHAFSPCATPYGTSSPAAPRRRPVGLPRLAQLDMLGMNLGKMPRFVHNFMQDAGSVHGAIAAYVQAVKQGHFPDNALRAW